ncbi:MAG: O-antigen polymerase [Deltaproteobacteria bacterium]|nr:O-antigen polymerase [Deltaproteobacteria bacterium]
METPTDKQKEGFSPSFICFLVWTFIVIGRPMDYISFLLPLRPVLVMTVLTLIVMFFERRGLPDGMFRRPEVRLVLLFYLIMLVGIPFAVHRGVAFRFVTTTMTATIIYFFVCMIQLRSMRRLHLTAVTIALSVLFSSSIYIIDAARYQGFRAAASAMNDPNDIAMVFTTFIPVCLYVLLAGHGWKNRLIAMLAACIAAAGIMMSRSRGGVLALAVVIVAFFLGSAPKIRGTAKIAVVIVLAFIFINFFSAVEGRFQDMDQDYNLSDPNGRINIWRQNLSIIGENPLLGAGAGCSAVALGLFRASEGGTQAWQTSHSSIFQIAVETGIPGLIVFLALNIYTIVHLRRVRRGRDHPLSRFAFFVELSFYGFWVGGLLLSHGYSGNLYLLLGITASIWYLHEHPAEADQSVEGG